MLVDWESPGSSQCCSRLWADVFELLSSLLLLKNLFFAHRVYFNQFVFQAHFVRTKCFMGVTI